MSLPMAKKRIHKEWADLQKEDLGNMVLAPKGDDMFHWEAKLPGPEGSVYDGGVFTVDIQLPTDYPFTPPKATFQTRIYHMNIADSGAICIDILKTNWSPALSLLKVLLSLSSLLTDPNPKDPLVPTIANQYTRSRKKHDETAREWTRLYAMPKAHVPPPSPVQKKALATRGPRGARARQTAAPVAAPVAASSSRVIEIDDDDEVEFLSTTTVRRTAAVAGRRRTRADAALEAESAEDTSSAGAAGRKRRRPNASANGTSMPSDDVIVID